MTLPLTIAVADSPIGRLLKSGKIPIEGVTPDYISMKPQIAAYRKMVRELAFDVCELAPTTYLIARSLGCPIIALPIFLMRRFHHGGLKIHPAAGIKEPKDLEGRQVGVRAYSVTTGVWTRAVLMEEYGLDSSKVTWVVDDEEHVEGLVLPPNVRHVSTGTSLYEMFRIGELAAGLDGNAGIGRSGDPFHGWKQEDVSDYPEMFPNAEDLERSWYARTGIYPIHGTLVVKQSVAEQAPWLTKSLFDACTSAKQVWLEELSRENGKPDQSTYRRLSDIVGPDPLPFGITPNAKSIEALQRAALSQRLISEQLPLNQLILPCNP